MKNLFNKFLIIALLLGYLPVSAQAAELEMTTTLQENLDNIVYITCGYLMNDDFVPYASGSGVVIGDSTVLTNAHVSMYIDQEDEAWLYDVCIGGIADNSYTAPEYDFFLEVVAYEYDDYYDYAFMQAYELDYDGNIVEYPFFSSATYGNPDSLVHGDELTLIGYPGAAGSTITTTQGIVSGFNGHNWIKSDAVAESGNSGGGAFDVLGNLIGIPTSVVVGQLNSITYIQNLNAIIENEFGGDLIQRDYTTLYSVENIVCVTDVGCFNFGEGEEADFDVEDDETEDLETISPDLVDDTSSDFTVLEGQYDPSEHDDALIDRMTGEILLQVEAHGEAYYLRPDDQLRYYMEDGEVAYEMMRFFGLGITSMNLSLIPEVETAQDMLEATSICASNALANQVKGQILLDVEQHGEAYYVYPDTCRRIYLKDGAAAYEIMRFLSKGITNADLAKIPTGTQIIR